VKRALLLIAALLAAGLWLVRDVQRADPPERPPVPRLAPAPAVEAAPASIPPLKRDPFRFGDERVPTTLSDRPAAPEGPPATLAPTPPALRLSGLMRRGGRLLAVLAVPEGLLVLGEGEEADGYRVLAIDEEAGARVRTPSGEEVSLPLEP